MRYRIALCGFSEFEHRAMHFSFQHPTGFRESNYDVVDALAEADFAIVDADSSPAVKGVLLSGRVAQAVFVGSRAPAGAASHLPRPIDPRRILQTLDELVSRPTPMLPTPEVHELPTLDDVVALFPPGEGPAAAAAPSTPASRDALHNAAKAAARTAARRARLASARAEAPAVEPLRDVLVLEADLHESARLCELLERFGFQPHPVDSIGRAGRQLALHHFAAMFLDIALDDAGVALLQHVRALPVPAGHPDPAVLLVAPHLDPAERVRAALVGLTAPLVKPLGRGDVARALEAAGVALPADARRL